MNYFPFFFCLADKVYYTKATQFKPRRTVNAWILYYCLLPLPDIPSCYSCTSCLPPSFHEHCILLLCIMCACFNILAANMSIQYNAYKLSFTDSLGTCLDLYP